MGAGAAARLNAAIASSSVDDLKDQIAQLSQDQRAKLVDFVGGSEDHEFETAAPKVDVTVKASLIAFLHWADIKVLRLSYVLDAPVEELADRRQGLPDAAFFDDESLHGVTIWSLSYAWQSAGHPDPNGQISNALKNYFNTHSFAKMKKNTTGIFWDHKCLYQNKMRGDWDPKMQTFEEGVVIRRTPAEETRFRKGLSGMQWLYFHTATLGLILGEVPEDAPNPTPYWKRGWPLMESAGLALSGSTSLIDLGGKKMVDVGPPIALNIADFEEELKKRSFTSQGDKVRVLKIYSEGFEKITTESKTLNATLTTPKDCDDLLKLIPHFHVLKMIELRFLLKPALQVDEVEIQSPALAEKLRQLTDVKIMAYTLNAESQRFVGGNSEGSTVRRNRWGKQT